MGASAQGSKLAGVMGKEYRFVCREVIPHGAVLDLLREIRGVAAFRIGDRPFAGGRCTGETLN